MQIRSTIATALMIGIFVSTAAEAAGPTPDTLVVDLKTATMLAAAVPEKFATAIEHRVTLASHGLWTREGEINVWTYRLSVPGAKTLSFHTDTLKLPPGVSLTQTSGDGQVFNYGLDATSHGFLWSRIGAGDTMTLQIRVPLDAQDPVFSIKSIQVGFKLPGAAVSTAQPQAVGGPGDGREDTSEPNQGCDTNFACVETASNRNQGRAVVAYSIENTGFCSGTLVNSVAGDLKPFIISAAHCANISDTDPQRAAKFADKASTSVIYWNATTPCGSALQPVTSAAVATTNVTTHRAEFNDTWLVEASAAPPAGSAAFWAGLDATDSAVGAGAYGIHHGAAKAKQFVGSSTALSKVVFFSLQGWQLDPNKGRTSGGSSGSGLFDPSGHYIGSLFGGSGGCPGNNIGQQIDIEYPRLAIAWAGDGTAARSLKPWLDSANTGALVTPGIEDAARAGTPVVSLSSSASTVNKGQTITLTWTNTKSDSCIASNGWTGSKPLNGNETVTAPNLTGNVTYTLSCTSTTPTTTAKSVTVSVTDPPPPPPPPPPAPDPAPAPVPGSASAPVAPASGGAFALFTLLLFSVGVIRSRRKIVSYWHNIGSRVE